MLNAKTKFSYIMARYSSQSTENMNIIGIIKLDFSRTCLKIPMGNQKP